MSVKQSQLEQTFRIHYYDLDAWGKLRADRLMEMFGEVAWMHANQLELGYDNLMLHNQLWVLSAVSIRFREQVKWGEQVILKTHISGQKAFYYFRDLRLETTQGRPLIDCRTQWIVLNADNRRPSRNPIVPDDTPKPLPALFDGAFPKLHIEEANLKEYLRLQAQLSDMDTNQHITNSRYLSWAMECYDEDFRSSHSLNRMDVQFTGESFPKNTLTSKRTDAQKEGLAVFDHQIFNESRQKESCKLRIQWLED